MASCLLVPSRLINGPDIKEEIEDDDAVDALRSLTMIAPADRVHLPDLLSFTYFTRFGAEDYT